MGRFSDVQACPTNPPLEDERTSSFRCVITFCGVLRPGRPENGDGEPAPHIIVGPPAWEKIRCPAIRRSYLSCCWAASSHRGAPTRSSRRRRDRLARAVRRSAACHSVPPIPACSAIPAASATHRGSRRPVQTRRCRRASTDPSLHHRHAWSCPMWARHSASSAQIRLRQGSRRSAAAAGHGSAGLPGFAGAVSAAFIDVFV